MMGKLEYLDALRRAMAGLAPEAQAKTLAFYEQRFVDGVDAGRSEQDIAKELDDPKKIAMTLRANIHMQAFETTKNPANFVRMAVAAVGLTIFNLFMVVPALVYAALLMSLYATGLAFYLGGTVVTASGLSGANEIMLDGPFRHIFVDDDDAMKDTQTKVNIGERGIQIFSEPAKDGKGAGSTTVTVGAEAGKANNKAAPAQASEAGEAAEAGEGSEAGEKRSVRVIKQAESVVVHGVLVSNDMDSDSRVTQTVIGLAMVLGGIILLLLSLVVTRYTFIGIKRYIDMNVSLLKGN